MRLIFVRIKDGTLAVLGLTKTEAQSIADGTHEPVALSLAQCMEQGYALPSWIQVISEDTDAEIETRVKDFLKSVDPDSAPELVNLADMRPPWEEGMDE